MAISKRQGSVESSTYAAEFMAGRQAVEEIRALRHALRAFGCKLTKPTTFLGDNEGMAKAVGRLNDITKKKHVSISFHMVREAKAANIIDIVHVPSKKNIADLFTKTMGPQDHCMNVTRFMSSSSTPSS